MKQLLTYDLGGEDTPEVTHIDPGSNHQRRSSSNRRGFQCLCEFSGGIGPNFGGPRSHAMPLSREAWAVEQAFGSRNSGEKSENTNNTASLPIVTPFLGIQPVQKPS